MTTVVSNGRALNVAAKSYPLPTSTPSMRSQPSESIVELLRGDGAYLAFDAIFRSQPMVYAAVTKLTNAIARNPLKVYEYGVDGESRQRVKGNELDTLLKKPHPRGSQFQLKASIAQNMLVYGDAIVVKARKTVGAPPSELWVVPMKNVSIIRDESGPIAYEITAGVQSVVLGPEDVIHIPLVGGSPLRPLARTLALEDAAITWQGQSLAQGMTQRGAFVTDQRLSDNAIPRMQAELQKLYSGVENAGRVALLEQGLKFQNIGVSAVDAELIAQRKLSREEVCAAYDIAPSLLGLERATYASVVEYRRALYDAVATRLSLIEETIQSHLVDGEPAWDGLFVEFDTNDLLRPDPEARARTHMLNQQSSVNTINERRRAENLPPLDDPVADTVFVPANMIPVGVEMPALPAGSTAGTPMQGVADQVTAAAVSASFGMGDANAILTSNEEENNA